MTARTWTERDPEPDGDSVPRAVVDNRGVTWQWDDPDEDGRYPHLWHELAYTRHPAGGTTGGLVCVEWWQLAGEYGPLREATSAEAGHFTVRFKEAS